MSEDKPLHVQVAEALGCVPRRWEANGLTGEVGCSCGGDEHSDENGLLYRYDTDWAATGPLIEKYGITLVEPEGKHVWLAGRLDHNGTDGYLAYLKDGHADGPTPLLAVCRLILALHKAGNLQ